MLHFDAQYQASVEQRLRELGFSAEDTQKAMITVHKLLVVQFMQLLESSLKKEEKKAFEEVPPQQFPAFLEGFLEGKGAMPREEAEQILNEVWESYFDAMEEAR